MAGELRIDAALRLTLGPRLLSALTLEHADGSAGEGVQHCPNQRGLLTAMVARRGRIGIVAGKDFVLEFVTHRKACPWTSQ
jgi:hypothetical protein